MIESEWYYRFFDGLELLPLRQASNGPKREVVVHMPGHLGDLLQLTPMLRSLRAWATGRRVTWLVGAWTVELARRYTGWVDEIREFSPQQDTLTRGNASWKRNVAMQWRDLRRLRKKGIDVLISTMPENPATRFVANTLNPRLWVGVGERRPPRVRTDIQVEMMPFEKDCPEAEAQLKLLDIVRRERGDSDARRLQTSLKLEFPVAEDEREWAGPFLEAEGAASKPFAILSPGSGWSGKNWPTERFSELATRLQARGLAVAWTGTPRERELCRGPGYNWMGKLTLGQLAALMERAAVWIGNDSGPLHLAVAVGCKTVSFWGPTSEGKWGGQGPSHVKVRGMTRCSECVYWDWRRLCPKEGHPCMNAISVDMAERGVAQVLGWG